MVTRPDERPFVVDDAGPRTCRVVLLAVLHVRSGPVWLPITVVVVVVVPALVVEAVLDALVELFVLRGLHVLLAVHEQREFGLVLVAGPFPVVVIGFEVTESGPISAYPFSLVEYVVGA